MMGVFVRRALWITVATTLACGGSGSNGVRPGKDDDASMRADAGSAGVTDDAGSAGVTDDGGSLTADSGSSGDASIVQTLDGGNIDAPATTGKIPSGVVLKPNPLISRGKPIQSPQSSANNAFDGSYSAGDGVWESNLAAADGTITDSYVTIDIGAGPTSLLLFWHNGDVPDYTVTPDVNYGVPTDYTIDVSADGTTWKNVVDVQSTNGITYRNRAHRFDFTGMSYVRFTITKCITTTGASNALGRIVEMDIFDASNGVDDTWLFTGSGPIRSGYDQQIRPSYADLVNMKHQAYNPAVIDIADTGAESQALLDNLDAWLALNPDFVHWVLPYGLYETSLPNEPAAFVTNMQTAITRLQAAGKQPIVPRLTYVAPAGCGSENINCAMIDAFNQAIDGLVVKNGLLPAPDLYAWFSAHPDQLCVQGQCESNWIGIEPNASGITGENTQWALIFDPLYKP